MLTLEVNQRLVDERKGAEIQAPKAASLLSAESLNSALVGSTVEFLDGVYSTWNKQGLTDSYCGAASSVLSQMADLGIAIDPNIERSVMKAVLIMNTEGLRSAAMSQFASILSGVMERASMPSIGNRSEEIVLFARSEEEADQTESSQLVDNQARLAQKLLLEFGDKPHRAKAA